jgi:hypothetical protein
MAAHAVEERGKNDFLKTPLRRVRVQRDRKTLRNAPLNKKDRQEKIMVDLERDRINPHLRERREAIATAVLAQLVGRAGEYSPQHSETALKAADALINALDAEGV